MNQYDAMRFAEQIQIIEHQREIIASLTQAIANAKAFQANNQKEQNQ